MKFSRSEISEKCLVQFGFFHFKFRSVLLDNFIKQKFLFSEEWQGWVVWSVSRLIFLTSVYPQRIRQFHSLNVITYLPKIILLHYIILQRINGKLDGVLQSTKDLNHVVEKCGKLYITTSMSFRKFCNKLQNKFSKKKQIIYLLKKKQ